MAGRLFIMGLLAVAACAHDPAAFPSTPAPEPPGEPAAAQANLEVRLLESVPSPEKEGISSLWIYVSGEKAGATEAGLMSVEKTWRGFLAPGNYPMRFVRWRMSSDDTWARDPEEDGLAQRFIRIEEGMLTTLRIRYHDPKERPELRIQREPLAANHE